jgi:lipid-A-disaccharide synthase
VVLLPGSRADEISRHLPLFLGVAGKLAAERRDLTWAVVTAPGMDDSVEACLRGASGFEVRAVHDPDYAIRALAALALTASGTSTLELGLLGVPEIVAYRGNWLNGMIARRLVRVPHVGLVNLILGRREVPELLQAAASPRALVDLSRRLLRGREAMVRARICARELRTALEPPRPPSASAVVAQDLLSDLAGFAG